MEHTLARTAEENDQDFLARVARRWVEAIEQDGPEPSEESLRYHQGAFLRRPKHGLQHVEIFATIEQYEHLLTVMNTAANPRTRTPQGTTPSDTAPQGTVHACLEAPGDESVAQTRLRRGHHPRGPRRRGPGPGHRPDLQDLPPHIRRAITARDKGCAFPGCTMPAPWCEAQHIEYWSRGGTTSTANGTLLRSHHHHLIHKEDWHIQVQAGVPSFTPPPHTDPRRTPRRNHYFQI
jgi:hypothetical protein